eukprot:gene551-624_t
MIGKKRNVRVAIVVGTVLPHAKGISLGGDDAKESSSEPQEGSRILEVCQSDISSESSAPGMCQPLPSGKPMNVRDGLSDISSESSAPGMCQPLPSGKLMNVRDELSDISSESGTPPMQERIQKQTDSEYQKQIAFSDVMSEASSGIASRQTGKTRYEIEKFMLEDLDSMDATSYEGDSLLMATELGDTQAVQRLLGSSSSAKRKSVFNVFRRKEK